MFIFLLFHFKISKKYIYFNHYWPFSKKSKSNKWLKDWTNLENQVHCLQMAINEVIIRNFKVLKNDAAAAGLEGFEMDIFSPSVKCNKLKCCANNVFLSLIKCQDSV